MSRRKNVLLVDDVYIISLRVNEATKTLKAARAGKNYIFTLGRVIVGKELVSCLKKWIGNLGKLKQYG